MVANKQDQVVGSSFEELKLIIDRIQYKERIGITIDTAHCYAGAYCQ